MKQFDWEKVKQVHSPAWISFVKKYHKQKLSEEEFVALYLKIPVRKSQKKSRTRGPSRARQEYKNLKANFGFFV